MMLVPGTRYNDTLIGTTDAEHILGRTGEDTLVGLAGADRLMGGPGDDVLYYDTLAQRIDGGPGHDTLAVAASGTTIDLLGHKQIFNIDVIDLQLAAGTTTLVLDPQEVMRLTTAPHTLQIKGFFGDSIYAGADWSYGGTLTDSLWTYGIYVNGEATLLVDADIQRSTIVDHAPDAQADKAITVLEDSGRTPLGITAPVELDSDPLSVTVTAVPNGTTGSVFLSASDGGTAVVNGQTLTIAALQGLTFAPVHNANGTAGTFSYTVGDQGTVLGLNDTQSIAIDVLPVDEGPYVIDNVPAYNWYHGCGPTAVASVFGYWDVHGYTKYFDADGWDAVRLTANVQDQISSPAHNSKYDPTPDNAALPVPSSTSIADYLHTSEDPLGYGWTWLSTIESGIEGYARFRGEPMDAWTVGFGTTTWQTLVNEIDAGHPAVFLVDSSGDGGTDHFVPVLAYDDRGGDGLWYGAYTTWGEDETISWFQFMPMAYGKPWGVGYVTFVSEPLASNAVAERTSTIGDGDLASGGFMNLDPDLARTGDGPTSTTGSQLWMA